MSTHARLAYARGQSDISVAAINAIGDLKYPTSSLPAAEHVTKKAKDSGGSEEKKVGGNNQDTAMESDEMVVTKG